ncbi:MAG TPA: hypothetical protein VKC66_06550 [Xanthobacteraceae bacterium]|nr:hypothetical protein [Xanthobacteraceae bacterium]
MPAVESRSWSHPQEPTTEEWWADVVADPRAQLRKRRSSELAIERTFYRLADEPRATILVAGSKPSFIGVRLDVWQLRWLHQWTPHTRRGSSPSASANVFATMSQCASLSPV